MKYITKIRNKIIFLANLITLLFPSICYAGITLPSDNLNNQLGTSGKPQDVAAILCGSLIMGAEMLGALILGYGAFKSVSAHMSDQPADKMTGIYQCLGGIALMAIATILQTMGFIDF